VTTGEGETEGLRRGRRGTDVESTPCLHCGSGEADVILCSAVQLSPATGEVFTFLRCLRCGLVYLSPRPTPEGMAAYYPSDYLPFRGADAWGRWAPLVRGAERRMDRARVRHLTRVVALSTASVVLDVGCGRPSFLASLRDATGATSVGIDPSDAGWRDDPGRWSDLHLIRGSVQANLSQLAERSAGGFHAITLWHALEHEHNPLDLLRQLRSLAAPGALLVVEVPNLASLSARLQGSSWGGLHTPRHTAAYTQSTLAALLEEAGWKVERHLRYGTLDPWALWWLGRAARRGEPLAGSQERRFPGFMAGKVASLPLVLLQRQIPLGLQLALARSPGG